MAGNLRSKMQKKTGTKNNWEEYISDNVLDMSLLQLTEFPAKNKIILPSIVTHLNVSNNLLTAIPPHLCMLIQIREMDLSKNKLISLPDQFGDLINLRKLDLYDNKLSFLPLSFYKLQKLRWLDISMNPVPQALLSIAGPCTNSSECEKAAKKVVLYFGVLNNQVSQEFVVSKAKRAEKEKANNEVQALIKAEVKNKKRKNKSSKKNEEESKGKEEPSVTDNVLAKMAPIKPQRSLWIYLFLVAVTFMLIGFAYTKINNVSFQEFLQCLKTGNSCY